MKVLSFRGGVHPEYFKDISIREPLRAAPLPRVAVVPLSQNVGAPNVPVVSKGDVVEEGQLLAKSDSFVSSPVHSPVYGKILDIKKAFHPSLGPVLSVFVERDQDKQPRKYPERDVENLSPGELVGRIRDAGIVGMGGAAFPTHVKLSPPEGVKIRDLVINGAECEPYLTCDHVVMTRKTQEVLRGIELIIRILEPERTYIAIEDNKKAAIFAFEKAIKESTRSALSQVRIAALKTKYPQGGEKQLIKAISGKEVPPGKLPFDVGFLVQNVGTVYAVYEAVYFDKPLIERVVTISGDCMNRPGNYIIRVGATIKDIVEQYGIEIYKEPAKVIVGGPMMGIAQPHTDVSVIKSTSGILFLSEQYARDLAEGTCIKCAKCVDVCPVNLRPTKIMEAVKAGRWDAVERFNPSDCMECGACSYICPARIPLVHYIKDAKSYLAGKKRK